MSCRLVSNSDLVPLTLVLPDLQHVDVIPDPDRLADVLIDEEDGQTVRLEALDRIVHLLRDDGREPHRGFVANQDLGANHHAARDFENLLHPARQVAGLRLAPFVDEREQAVHSFELAPDPGLVVAEGPRAEPDVLLHRQVREHGPFLRQVADSQPGHVVAGPAREVGPVPGHRPLLRVQEPADHPHQRGLPRPVGSDDRGDLILLRVDGDILQDVELVDVPGVVSHIIP